MSTRFTREHLHRLGYRPDGQGRFVKIEMVADTAIRHVAVTDTDEAPQSVWSPTKKKPKLNACERRWLEELQARHPAATIVPQYRLRVGDFDQDNPVYFTADFAVFHRAPADTRFSNYWHCVLWEVKDKRRGGHSDELTRPKLVHKNNPFVASVRLAIWDGNTWEERILS